MTETAIADAPCATPITLTVALPHQYGLPARACLAIANIVRRHSAEVTVQKNGQTANAASILELMSFATTEGTEFVFSAKGPDALRVLDVLALLFANDFSLI